MILMHEIACYQLLCSGNGGVVTMGNCGERSTVRVQESIKSMDGGESNTISSIFSRVAHF